MLLILLSSPQTDPITGIITPVDTLNDVNAIVMMSGAVSTSSYHYTFRYLSNSYYRLMTVSIATGEIIYDVASDYNIVGLKYGCNDLLYALWHDPQELYHLVVVDPQTGNQNDLGVVTDLSGIFFGTFSFDSDDDWFMVRGIDINNDNRLYSIDVNTGAIINSPISNDNVRGNEYDCNTHTTYGLKNDPITDWEYFVSLDPLTGNSALIDTMFPVSAVTTETYSLNHDAGQYTFGGLMASASHLYTVDVNTGTIIYNVAIADYVTETDQFICCGKPNGTENVDGNSINIFPDPVKDFVTISRSNSATAVLKIYNLNGKVVLTESLHEMKSIVDFTALSPGIYFVQLTGKGSTSVLKIVKE
jgi:hypothetical protein